MNDTIIRVAAKGDGITASGRHVPRSAPGDTLLADGTLVPGPNRAEPACGHFGRCGGCELQHISDDALATFVRERVAHAAEGQGLQPGRIAPPHLSPPASRRRANLRAINGGGRPLIGFREAGSHKLVDVRECAILVPELMAVIEPLRKLFTGRNGRWSVEVELALTDQGADANLKGLTLDGLAETEAMLNFAREHGLARLTLDQGYGPETLWEPEPVTVTLSGAPVPFPSGSFLQATKDGEQALVDAAREWIGDAATIADLFSGLGTFAFALAGPAKVLAAEAAQDAYLACKAAAARTGKPVHSLHRDLFRNPLRADELSRFEAVLLDPPRAGARDQVAQLAASTVRRIVYISCNPSSWARDARQLADAGYRLMELRPVGQFRWSTHVELASLFVREDA
ncbi:class I SAM-dependent RNA methyltransferase [Altericroceibacterium xinjiangense]|uniref:class I SAM-dependent RNA methyltransferase n=1 Tax=Altericroceibacterium xinjiangense TaxID=762261 RepID=UPI003B97944F